MASIDTSFTAFLTRQWRAFAARLLERDDIQRWQERLGRFWAVAWDASLVVFYTSLILFMILVMSIFGYVALYNWTIPAHTYTLPVHLQFSPIDCNDDKSHSCYPHASVALTSSETADFMDPMLVGGQRYEIGIELEMPESPVNEHLGVFMIELELLNADDRVLHSTARPGMLRFRSGLQKAIKTLVFGPLLIIDYQEEKQLLRIPLINSYQADLNELAAYARVRVNRPQLEIYRAGLYIDARLEGVKYWMYHFRLPTGIILIGANFSILLLIAGISTFRRFFQQRAAEEATNDEIGTESETARAIEQPVAAAPPTLSGPAPLDMSEVAYLGTEGSSGDTDSADVRRRKL